MHVKISGKTRIEGPGRLPFQPLISDSWFDSVVGGGPLRLIKFYLEQNINGYLVLAQQKEEDLGKQELVELLKV